MLTTQGWFEDDNKRRRGGGNGEQRRRQVGWRSGVTGAQLLRAPRTWTCGKESSAGARRNTREEERERRGVLHRLVDNIALPPRPVMLLPMILQNWAQTMGLLWVIDYMWVRVSNSERLENRDPNSEISHRTRYVPVRCYRLYKKYNLFTERCTISQNKVFYLNIEWVLVSRQHQISIKI
jgi:hypothetical protein